MKSFLSFLVFSTLTSLVVSVLASSAAFATPDEDFNALKDTGMSFVVVGAICEEVARLDMAKEFKVPQYDVVTGIAYGNSRKTIGELDVIVFAAATGEVVKIAEVKCWQDGPGGLKKALEQRKRFLKHVTDGGLFFQSTHDKRQYAQKQFRKVKDFETIGPFGSKDEGYNRELNYTLSEVMNLRKKIMTCQQNGECARAE